MHPRVPVCVCLCYCCVCVCWEGVLVLISMYSQMSLTLVREQHYIKNIYYYYYFTNSWKTRPLWNNRKLLLSKIVQKNASQKNDRYWTDGHNIALSCTITNQEKNLENVLTNGTTRDENNKQALSTLLFSCFLLLPDEDTKCQKLSFIFLIICRPLVSTFS